VSARRFAKRKIHRSATLAVARAALPSRRAGHCHRCRNFADGHCGAPSDELMTPAGFDPRRVCRPLRRAQNVPFRCVSCGQTKFFAAQSGTLSRLWQTRGRRHCDVPSGELMTPAGFEPVRVRLSLRETRNLPSCCARCGQTHVFSARSCALLRLWQIRGRPPRRSHPSTNRALCRLTLEVRRDPMYSTRYGRQQQLSYGAWCQFKLWEAPR
jgi:hypothetical protein